MKLAQLAAASGCSMATIKYYLREGLLQPGERVSTTEAEYGPAHVARLRMIRVLRDVGDMPISSIKAVIAALDTPDMSLRGAFSSAFYAIPPLPDRSSPVPPEVRAEVRAFIDRHGWTEVAGDAPAIDVLGEALMGVRQFWGNAGPEIFERYAAAMDDLGRGDVEVLDDVGPGDAGRATAIAQIIVGVVVWDRAILALRRLSEEHYSALRYYR